MNGTLTLGTASSAGKGVTIEEIGNTTWNFKFQDVIQDATDLVGAGGDVTIGSGNNGTVWFSAANTFTGDTIVEGGKLRLQNLDALQNSTLDTGSSGTQSVTLGLTGTYNIGGLKGADDLVLASSTRTISVGANNSSNTYSGIISGSGAFTKVGDGTQILTGENTYAGATTISDGTLQVGDGGSTGSLGAGAIVNNADLVYDLDKDGIASLPSAGISGSGNLSATAGKIALNGDVTLGGSITLTEAAGTSATYSGISVFTDSTLTANSITLNGDIGKELSPNGNSLVLDTSDTNGTINLEISLGKSGQYFQLNSFEANAGTGTINVTGSDTWRLTPVTLKGSVMMTGDVNSQALVTIDSNGTDTGTVSGIFSSSMALTKSGAGSLTLTGTNTYSGGTTLTEGTLVAGNDAAFGTGAVELAGGILTNDATRSIGNAINITGTSQISAAANYTLSGALTGAGTLNTGGDASGNATLFIDDDLSGFSGTVNYTNASDGNNVNFNGALDTTAKFTLSQGTGTGRYLRFAEDSTIGELSGTDGAFIINTGKTLTINQSTDTSFGGVIGIGAAAGGITKAGTGSLTLTGANAFTGATTVSGGTLIVDGSLASGSAVSVSSGAAIGGDGTIGGDLFLAAGAEFLFSETETLTVGGTLSFGGFSVADLVGLDSSIAEGTYTIVGGSINTANLSNLGFANAFDLGDGKSAYFQEGSLQLVVVPEPGAYALLAGLLGLSYVMVRRREV